MIPVLMTGDTRRTELDDLPRTPMEAGQAMARDFTFLASLDPATFSEVIVIRLRALLGDAAADRAAVNLARHFAAKNGVAD